MKNTPKISVRCRYYKHQAAIAVLDHAHHKRNGFTHSQNVNTEFSHHNAGFYFHGVNVTTLEGAVKNDMFLQTLLQYALGVFLFSDVI